MCALHRLPGTDGPMAAKLPPAITLTTDFGNRDPWVAAMKGVIVSIAPQSPIVDLSHGIAPQNLLEGALFMAAAVPWFPPGNLIIADPSGVGVVSRDRLLLTLPSNFCNICRHGGP